MTVTFVEPPYVDAEVAAVPRHIVQTFNYDGPLAAATGGSKFAFPVASVLNKITLLLGVASTVGSVTVDVNKGTGSGAPSTIFTNQAHRPSCGVGIMEVVVVPPNIDVQNYSADDWMTVDIDLFGTGAQSLTVVIDATPLA